MRVLVLFTCFNRKTKSEECIRTLVEKNKKCEFSFVVADDGSTDGTYEMLTEMQNDYDIHLLRGTGNWFYTGGMIAAMTYVTENTELVYDYIAIVNDDVQFYDCAIEKIIDQSKEQDEAVIVGATCKTRLESSYGAIKYIKRSKYKRLSVTDWEIDADTFNANCVLIPKGIFRRVGIMDSYFKHSLGDFDYGIRISRAGFKIHSSKEYVGLCNRNETKGTWVDNKLKIIDRIKKKESIKGAPSKQWFYFLNKYFGLFEACKGVVTPYIRILIRK